MRKFFSAAISALLAVIGCQPHDDYLRTPLGYKVAGLEDRGYSSRFTTDDVLNRLDARILQWIDQRGPQYGTAYCFKVASSIQYWIRDDYMFQLGDQWVYGWTMTGNVTVSLWSHGWGPILPGGTPEWCDRFNPETGNWNWGWLSDGVGLDAVGHELDHHLNIHHDGEMLTCTKCNTPKDGYTIFCMNCNFATRYGAVCPHRAVP